MEFRKVLALRGPNVWAHFPVLEAWVDLQELKDSPSNTLPGFNERLMAWLPTMIEHRCGLGYRGGFFERLRTGTYQGHILEHASLELQALIGVDVGYGRARETSEDGVYKVVIEYRDEEVGRAVLETARRMLDAAVKDLPFDVQAELAELRALHQRVCLGPSTNAIVEAARNRGIPVRRLNTESLVQLGYGSRQRRILAAQTDRTGAVAEAIAQDKQLTRSLLRAMGVPVPEGRPVTDAEDAWKAAQEIGVAVVVKPQYGSQGRGVATDLTTREQVMAAYNAAREESRWILVERYAPGADYRLLVVGDRVVAAARREPAQVVGDGRSTVKQLIDQVNLDPRRGDDHATVLSKLKLDAIALGVLGEQSFTADSVPPAGQKVLIRRNANLSTGGTAADVTDEVHPEVAARVVEAAKMVGLDVAGVDVVAVDISQPLESQGGIVVEVNASPGLRMHIEPSSGKSRPVGEAIIDSMFAPGENGRIPIVAITGVNGKTTTTRFIASILRSTGRKVGMTCTEGVFIDDRRVDSGDCSGPMSAQSVLANPLVDAAVLETARGGILRAGLGFDLCDVAVVTNIGEGDHLGLADIDTIEKLAKVKRCIVEAVSPEGYAVLKADDPQVAEMAEYCPGSVIFFAQRADDLDDRPASPWRRPSRVRRMRYDHAGRRQQRHAARLALRRAAHARRTDRLPGGKHLGLGRCRLGPGPAAGRDPQGSGIVRRRHGKGARPVQPARRPRGDGDRRLRPQHFVAAGHDRSDRTIPASAPDRGLHRRRRPPRRRHDSPGRAAGRGLRPRDPVRRPLRPRTPDRRDHGPVTAGHVGPRPDQ